MRPRPATRTIGSIAGIRRFGGNRQCEILSKPSIRLRCRTPWPRILARRAGPGFGSPGHLVVKSLSTFWLFPANHLLLVALLVEIHPTTKGSRAISTEPLRSNESGLGVEWRKGPEVMFRPPGAERPH